MLFRELNINDLKMVEDYKNSFLKDEESIHGASGLEKTDSLVWLKNQPLFKSYKTIPNKNFVTAHTFVLTNNTEIIGIINLRHELNDYLFNFGGHIGYSINKKFRNQGYGKLLLKNCLDYAFNELGLNKVLITCNENNIASKKLIISCGGILENIITDPTDNNIMTERYWIKKDS
ncbi:GNAT family N-acetyltransferase [Gemella sp. GH3]|uniref:GNAT family N-acetyltransferase n=1 Tax=unclassified Gemella TaxID=2624949 RepID=UPI0015CFCE9C|nr:MULTISPECIES: GNAT family N-acetyltransferase [unclassified Gemella]MBF0713565.1 GNAT family N-acetyltransferase [Gemella sp. GH3.1]NYS50517.1 GNAT family N-acetyltransferase [Gemella sp. GH3]